MLDELFCGPGCRCNECKRREASRQFPERAAKLHNNKYDYSKVEYENNSTKVCIICPEHGKFWLLPNNHLQGQGCPECGEISRKDKVV